MFIALNEKGEHVNILQYNKQLLVALRKNNRFFCPVCEQGVQLKIGEKKKPHFAHYHNNCSLELERESCYHLLGKEELYRWLTRQGMTVHLEPYLKNIQQRPDLLILEGKIRIAVEYQCSSIPHELVLKRTESYWKEGIRVLWILGGNQFKRIGVHWLQVSTFHTLFAQCKSPPNLLYFCPHAKGFYLCSNLIPFTSTTAFSNITYLPLQSVHFSSIITHSTLSFSALSDEWNRKKRNWRANGLSSFRHTHFDFLAFLYEKRISPSLFPSEAAIPLPSLISIQTPALLWQSYLLLEEIDSIPVGQCFSLPVIVSRLTAKGRWSARLLLYFPSSFPKLAFFDYALYLQAIGYITQVGPNIFRKNTNIRIPKDEQEALYCDKKMMKTALSLFRKAYVTLL